jgi:hypothetical protein
MTYKGEWQVNGLDNSMAAYEYFELYNDWPNLVCIYKNYVIEDGFLSFFTGENAYFNICQMHVDLDICEIDIEAIANGIDRIKIKCDTQELILYAYKKKSMES